MRRTFRVLANEIFQIHVGAHRINFTINFTRTARGVFWWYVNDNGDGAEGWKHLIRGSRTRYNY